MSLIKNASRTSNTLRLALLATAVSVGMFSVVTAQTVPPTPPTLTSETFFTGKLQPANWLASSAMDEPVLNLQKEKIGELNDLVIDGDGKVVAAVVGVGGFLGMGEKDVAINIRAIRMSHDEKGTTSLVLDVTKDALKAAPAYKAITTATSN